MEIQNTYDDEILNLLRIRNVKLTQALCIWGGIITVILSLILAFTTKDIIGLQILSISMMFFVIYFLLKKGKLLIGRLLLCYILPILVYFISIFTKRISIELGIYNPINFFDTRIILLTLIIVPFVSFNIREYKLMALGMLPILLGLVLFDPIHNLVGVGYYQSGLEANDYYFSSNLFILIAFIFIGASLMYTKFQVENSSILQFFKISKMENSLESITRVANSPSLSAGLIDDTLREIVAAISRITGANRVGIWEFDASLSTMYSIMQFENGKISYDKNELHRTDFPIYFKNITQNKIISADNAQEDLRLFELKEGYLTPKNIHSLFDSIYIRNNNVKGVICCESVGKEIKWNSDDLIFVNSMGELITSVYVSEKLNKEGEKLNSMNNELRYLNQKLEDRIKRRTEELKLKNQQLEEYAFVNSHIIRSPLTTIAGLLNIWNLEIRPEDRAYIISKLHESVNNMDKISFQIENAINQYGEFRRENLK